jgi:hypothetical protein
MNKLDNIEIIKEVSQEYREEDEYQSTEYLK